MASFQKTQDIDVLSVRKIYAKGESNRNIAQNSILATDGIGGTSWISLSTINIGTSFNTISTSLSTFTASLGNTTFSILNSSNIGLIPTSGNAVSLYSKSFGQIDVSGQNSINSFNSLTGTFSNSVELISIGLANFSTDTTRNKIYLLTPSTFLHTELSTFSTALGPTVQFPQMISTFSTFSTSLATKFYTNSISTSTISLSGVRQPVIQYGSSILTSGTTVVSLTSPYVNPQYVIQLTYLKGASNPVIPLSFSTVTSSNFAVYGDSAGKFHWTTYGSFY